jgi:hypothetical protein
MSLDKPELKSNVAALVGDCNSIELVCACCLEGFTVLNHFLQADFDHLVPSHQQSTYENP